jgi:DHA2 family multidrug resistance protein
MLAKGLPFNEARQRALALLDATVRQQAAVMSFADTFWATAALIVMFLQLVFLLGKPNKGATVEMGH